MTDASTYSYFLYFWMHANVAANLMEKLRAHIEAVTPLTDEEFEHVRTFFTLKRVRKNQYLLHEGDEVKHEFLVLAGIYKVFYVDADGKEHILQFAR